MTESLGGACANLTLENVARSVDGSKPALLPCVIAGGDMRRLFTVWNRGYKTQLVIATDATEALEISAKSKHIKRPNMYRRFLDVTDDLVSQDDRLEKALNADVSGIATNIEDNGWLIDDVPVS